MEKFHLLPKLPLITVKMLITHYLIRIWVKKNQQTNKCSVENGGLSVESSFR